MNCLSTTIVEQTALRDRPLVRESRAMGPPELRIIGQNARRLRLAAKLSQEKLAKVAGVSKGTIINLEKGKLGNVDFSTISTLAASFGCRVLDLLTPPAAARAAPETKPKPDDTAEGTGR